MQKSLLERVKKLSPKQRIALGVFILAVILAPFMLLRPPERSVDAYCKEYELQNTMFPHGKDKYSAGIFTSNTNDPRRFAEAYGALERVAPDDIRYDVKTLKVVFEKMDKDPSQVFSAALSGLAAEASVKNWTQVHCRDQDY